MNIRELSPATLTVANLHNSLRFYHEVFDLPMLESDVPGVKSGDQTIQFQLGTPVPTDQAVLKMTAKNKAEDIRKHFINYGVHVVSQFDSSVTATDQALTVLVEDPDHYQIEITILPPTHQR
ncbi:VOC family protein [Levilactobacillus bambusae]|uniref:VOC family virulence protein n=1 Tax=Levilactobacillus bambusae TaxID=2024736 RepID=A0A2V1MZ59_9LACO|nr:VOC family protein [Levilactobacillus bambusae]PWG00053.1 VOC family virulence protein [Levilactobacillus bambusae]